MHINRKHKTGEEMILLFGRCPRTLILFSASHFLVDQPLDKRKSASKLGERWTETEN